MRRAARTDANQKEIVSALRAIGCSVQDLSKVGMGLTDLLVGYRNVNLLIEAKDGSKPPSKRKKTPSQIKFHDEWRGQKTIVESPEQAISYINDFFAL